MTSQPADNSPALRVAVVGGGISGLSAAFRLIELSEQTGRPLELTLLEAGERVGGAIGTERIVGYLVERGGDMFITDKPWAVDLCRRLGLEHRLIGTDETFRRSLVLRRGRPVPIPEGFLLLAPAKVGPLLASPIFSPWGKLRMALEYFVARRRDEGDESLASFVRRRFGSEALDRLVQPLVGGIYTADPEQLSLHAALPRFAEMERRHRSLIRASKARSSRRSRDEQQTSGARYGLFLSLDDGLSILIDELQRRVRLRGTVRLNTPVSRIDRDPAVGAESAGAGWRITFGDGGVERFDRLVVAVHSHQAAELLQGVDAELAGSLRRIPYASSAVVISGHRLRDVAHPLDAFGLVVPHLEGRKVFAVSFASRKFPCRAPDGCVLLRTFVGGALQPELLEQDDGDLQEMVRGELTDILGVGGEPDFSIVVRYPNAMPQYHLGHLELIERIERRASTHSGLALAGNAYHGVGLPDCIHSGEQAAARVLAGLAATR